MLGLLVVGWLRPENVRHERLRISIVQREPARLDLHHDSVPGQKHVVRRRQRESCRASGVFGAIGFGVSKPSR